jgi:hypothetical protein
MKKYQISILFLFTCIILSIHGQNKSDTIDNIKKNLEEQLKLYPQEKVYLQTDKPSYISGETIWLRPYLQDAITHRQAIGSRYVYVELIDDKSLVVGRVKIKPDEHDLHYGYLKIPEKLQSGDYRLKAYTQYQTNQGEDYFYSKNISIYAPDDKNLKNTKKYKESSDYDVMFFPEGGYLLEGTMCQVAFKVLNNLGQSEDITGDIINSDGTILSTIGTYHKGMGVFSLNPEPGKKYYMTTKNSQGKSKRFELPKAEQDHYSLNVRNANDGYLYVSILHSKDISNPQSLILMIHTGGIIQYLSYVENINKPLIFDKKDFSSGVSQILLLDANKHPLSERLVFVKNDDQARLNLKSDKDFYSSRDEIILKTKVTDNKNKPLSGNYSVSVIDGLDIMPDTTSTILSTMLLTSELKGQIEDPGYYFRQNDWKTQAILDILMMTQGWRRYNIPDAINGHYEMPSVQYEQSQQVTGMTINEGAFRNTKLKEGKVMFLVPDIGFMDETETDNEGRFIFKDFELPDSLKYVVQAQTKKGGKWVELALDEETFPNTGKYIFFRQQDKKQILKTDTINWDYIAKADQKYTLENGMRMIHLKDVEILAKRREKRSIYAAGSNQSFDSKYIEQNHILEVGELIRRTPGAEIVAGRVILRNAFSLSEKSNVPALIIIDDVIVDQEYDDNPNSFSGLSISELVDINDIERVDIVKSVAGLVILGSRGYGGAVVITTKKGESRKRTYDNKNVKTFIPLGYQTPAEFYSPKYGTKQQKEDQKPDLRTTIYWKPDVMVSEKGEAELSFYAADNSSVYYIVIEGVTDDGKLIYDISIIDVHK